MVLTPAGNVFQFGWAWGGREIWEQLLMMRIGLALVVFLGVFAGPASAQVPCTAPFLPVVPDGATATQEQLNEVRQQVEVFVRESDEYQNCLVTFLRQQEAEAARDRNARVDPQLRQRTVALVNANQSHKIRVSEEFNAAARAYNEAHPTDADESDSAAAASPES
jgi:hypothetical protein